VKVDAFVIRLRRRSDLESADLGVRLCQSELRAVFFCFWLALLPVAVLSMASFEIAPWLPTLVLWWAKPWLDRTVLFVLARAAFGQRTTAGDVWRAQRQVWWSQLLRTLTTRRLSPWRSFTQPIYQLEGLRGGKLRRRVLQIRSGHTGNPLLVTSAFSLIELTLTLSLGSLAYWFAPPGYEPQLMQLLQGEGPLEIQFALAAIYVVVVGVLEPFYVAAGFTMYLNRRVELEAWDIEQEFRRAFAG
jgi:hypothetical protein